MFGSLGSQGLLHFFIYKAGKQKKTKTDAVQRGVAAVWGTLGQVCTVCPPLFFVGAHDAIACLCMCLVLLQVVSTCTHEQN